MTGVPPLHQYPPRISIIIVNWNGREHLPECLESLAAQTCADFETIVVDNGSTDGSVALLRQDYPWVRLVALPENTGFAGGNNAGLAVARGEYLVTLNNDTRAEPDWLATLVAVADAHPGAGMVGCRVCSYDEPERLDSLGFGVCPDGMSRGLHRHRRFAELSVGPVLEILFPSACAALYRRAMLEETGFFDEAFFAYAEDSDLGLRGRLAGWGAVAATDAVVRHKYSMTGGAFSPLKLYLVERNHYWAALKTFPPAMLLQVPFHTLRRYLVQARAVLQGRGAGGELRSSASAVALAAAILRGTLDALRGAPAMLRQRRRIMAAARLSPREMTALLRRYRLSFEELLDVNRG